MKKVLIFSALFLLASVSLSSQVVKGAGLWYFNGVPNVTPSTGTGTEVAYSINNKALYKWNRTTAAWEVVVRDSSATNELQNLSTSGDTLYLSMSAANVPLGQYKNRVWEITALSDTSSITGEVEGDVAYVSSGDTVAFRDALYWLPFTGGGGGGTFNSFNIAGDTGSSIVTDGQTVTVAGGYGINTAEAGGTVTTTVDTTQLKAQYLPKTLTSATEVNTAGQNLYFRDAGGFPYWFMNNSLFSAASGATTFISIGSTANTVEINSGTRTFIQSLGNSEVQAAAELRLDADSLVLDGLYPVGGSGDSVLVRDASTKRIELRAQSDIGGGGAMTSFTLAGTSGTPQTITNGNTATIAAGTGITTTASATDQVTVAINVDSIAAWPSGTGTNLRIPVWTGANSLGSSTLLQSATGQTLDANLAFRITGGTTASRPTGAAGMTYYNTSNNWFDLHNGTSWFNPARSSTVTGLFTAGAMLFGNSDGTIRGDDEIYWDLANNRLGVNTTSPQATLEVVGNIILNSTGVEKIIYPNSTAGSLGLIAGASTTFDATTGAFFGMRGNTYTAVANQRGNLFFFAGAPTTPGATEGLIRFGTGANLVRMTIVAGGNIGIGTIDPDRLLHSEISGSATNTIGYPFRASHITSGTAAAGFGSGIEFEAESAGGTNRVSATIENPYTTATNAAEVSDLVIKTMRAGTLTEAGRFLGAGGLTVSTTGSGVSGVTATSSTLYGVKATSTAGTAAYYGETENATTNTLLLSQYLARSTTGTAANGIGQEFAFATETTAAVPFPTNSIKSLWTDATHASRTSQLIFTGVSAASVADILTLEGNGQVKANTYGVGTHTGTAARNLQVTSAGAVIEKALPAYGEASIFGSQTLAFLAGSTFYDTLSGYTSGELSGFSLVGGALKYTGTETIKVRVNVSISLTFAEAGQVFAGIRQNTTNVTKSRAQQKIDTAADVNNIAMTCILTLATNDLIRIELAPSAHTGDDNITVSNCNFNITEI
jgi:hypothetical protein